MESKNRRTPGFLIGRASHLLQSEIRAGLQRAGSPLSPEGASIMLLLISVGEPIRVSKLAKLAVRDGTTLKRQLDGLYKIEYVEQTADVTDGRVVLVSHTQRGLDAIKQLEPVFDSIETKALKGIPESDFGTMLESLNKIQMNLLEC